FLLKQAGAKVALVDRHRCAAADTGHTTAHLTYVTDTRLHQVVKSFGQECAHAFWDAGAAAIDQIHQLVTSEKIDCDFQWVPGYLHQALGESGDQDRDLLRKDAELAKELGFRAEFVENVPYARRAGVRFADQAKFHPRKYLAGLLKSLPGDGS